MAEPLPLILLGPILRRAEEKQVCIWLACSKSVTIKAGQNKYREQVRQLEKTRRDLPAVRRLLANIPTYMIFDDHEITDDWNITREWVENVRASKCGKQIVANGLAAY